jgi:anti-anti-sigma factor
MARLTLEPLVASEFFLVVAENGDQVRLRLSGSVDMDAVPMLDPFLRRLHAEVLRERFRLVVFDLSGLQFMSSSPLQCFVAYINLVNKLAAEQRYGVRFVSNPKLHWQRRSLEALYRFAPDVVSIESGAAPGPTPV